VTRARQQAPHFPADGHFAQLARLGEVGPDTVVRRRAGLTPRVERREDGAALRFAASTVGGPADLEPAFTHIRDHERFRVADLPGALDDESKVVLVRRLIRDGLLRAESGEENQAPDGASRRKLA
jgi:hypothetical protein